MSDMAFLKAKEALVTTASFLGPSRIFGIFWASTAGGGAIVIRDGGAGGTVKIQFTVPVGSGYINIPQKGVKYDVDVHVTLPATTNITVFYDPPQT